VKVIHTTKVNNNTREKILRFWKKERVFQDVDEWMQLSYNLRRIPGYDPDLILMIW